MELLSSILNFVIYVKVWSPKECNQNSLTLKSISRIFNEKNIFCDTEFHKPQYDMNLIEILRSQYKLHLITKNNFQQNIQA